MMTDLSPDSTRGWAGCGHLCVEDSREDRCVYGWAPLGAAGGFMWEPGAQGTQRDRAGGWTG